VTVTRLRTALAVLSAAAVLIGWAAPAGADPHDDQQRVNQQLAATHAALEAASARVDAAVAAYTEANAQLPIVQARLAQAQGVLVGAQVQARAAQRVADAARADAAAAGADFDRARLAVDDARNQAGAYAASLYKGRDVAALDAVLTASSPDDVIDAMAFMEQIGHAERVTLQRVTTARLVAKESQNASIRAQQTAETAEQAALDALDQAAAAKAAADAQAEQLNQLIAARKAALAVATAERASTLARYQALQKESERIAAEIRALAGQGGGVLTPGLTMPMPVHGYKSSDFGMRYDPFYHVWQLHAGTDFAAPEGSPIWAVLPGRVFQAGWDGGYGNYTCIYHGLYEGKGLATCYAHQSQILVHVGQYVSAGQLIGRVGTTGASTGYHLHFEVRLNGEPVNPLPWLPACLCW
jgi:murein DD-endopeptidase MepM/ murein hydrolase activator NlpD